VSEPVQLLLPPEAIEAIAQRAAELVLAQLPARQPSPYLSVDEAAVYLRCTKQRVYDLVSAGRLPRHKDGARLLLRRSDLDALVAG
jgi:excisionase family DNA binding protein